MRLDDEGQKIEYYLLRLLGFNNEVWEPASVVPKFIREYYTETGMP